MFKLLNSLGLIFFTPMMNLLNDKGIMCSLVVFNGILCHVSRAFCLKYWKAIRNYDILCNLIMGSYIIHYSNYNAMIMYLDFLSIYMFMINYLYFESNFLIHVLCVQYPLSYVAHLY